MEAMRCLLRQGMPIYRWKCLFLRRKTNILGLVMAGERYHLGKKALGRLISTSFLEL